MDKVSPDNNEQSEAKELEKALELANKGIESTSKALLDGATLLNEASQKFSEKEPGQRASWLGFMLIVIAIALEIASAITEKFDFSDINSTSMLIMGGILVASGAAFDTYFTVKVAQSHESRAQALEKAAKETLEEAQKARDKGLGLLSKLVGRSE